MLIALVLAVSVVAVVGLLVLLRALSLLAVAAERADHQLHYATSGHQDQLNAVFAASRAHLESILTAAFEQSTRAGATLGGAVAEASSQTATAIGGAVAAAGSAISAAMVPPAPAPADQAWAAQRDAVASDTFGPEPDFSVDPTDNDPYLSPDRTDAAAAGTELNPTGVPNFAFTPEQAAPLPPLVSAGAPTMPGVPLPFNPGSSSAAGLPLNGTSPFGP